jgi:carbamoyl-phosphate synthase large subunit
MMGQTLRELGYESGLWALGERDDEGGTAACALAEVSDQFGIESERVSLLNSAVKPSAQGYIIPESAFATGRAKLPEPLLYAIKAPVFSFQKLSRVEPSLGPEMKSTGEILGIDRTFEAALYKALVASGIHFKGDGVVLMTVRDEDKPKAIEIAKELHSRGKQIAATRGTAMALKGAGVPCDVVLKISEGDPNLLDLIMNGGVSLMVNSPSADKVTEAEAARIRRACIETGIPCVTSIDTAGAIMRAMAVFEKPELASCLRLEEYFEARA